MEPRELDASLRVLLAVASADGAIDSDERRLLNAAAERLGGTLHVRAVSPRELDDALSQIGTAEARDLTFTASVALANVDGRCTAEEHALLEKIRDALAPGGAIPLERCEHDWAKRMRAARARIDHVEGGFLDRLAKERDSLSAPAYQRLVAELDRSKAELLAGAVFDA
jgi:tellurite resistance protein